MPFRGASVEPREARIFHIAGHYDETSPTGRFLFVENDDRPGILKVLSFEL